MYKDLILEKTKQIIDAYFYICDSIKAEPSPNTNKAVSIDENYKLVRTDTAWYIRNTKPEMAENGKQIRRVCHHNQKGRNDEIGELIKKFLELYI